MPCNGSGILYHKSCDECSRALHVIPYGEVNNGRDGVSFAQTAARVAMKMKKTKKMKRWQSFSPVSRPPRRRRDLFSSSAISAFHTYSSLEVPDDFTLASGRETRAPDQLSAPMRDHYLLESRFATTFTFALNANGKIKEIRCGPNSFGFFCVASFCFWKNVIRNPLPLPSATSTSQVDEDSVAETERRRTAAHVNYSNVKCL